MQVSGTNMPRYGVEVCVCFFLFFFSSDVATLTKDSVQPGTTVITTYGIAPYCTMQVL